MTDVSDVKSVRELLDEIAQLRAQLAEALAARNDSEARCLALRDALLLAADAINECAEWHDENADDYGEDTCGPGEPCDCKLPNAVNAALRLAGGGG